MPSNSSDVKPQVVFGTSVADQIAIAETVSDTFDAHPVYGTGGTGVIAKATAAQVALAAAHASAVAEHTSFVDLAEESKNKFTETQGLLATAQQECRQLRDACFFEFAGTTDDPSAVGFQVNRYKTAGSEAQPKVVIPASVPQMLLLLPRLQATVTAGTYAGTTIEPALNAAVTAVSALSAPYAEAVTKGQISSSHRAKRDAQLRLCRSQLRVLRDFGFAVFPDDYEQIAEFGFQIVTGSSNPTTTDTDGDGIPDDQDPDIDGDGVPNEDDADPFDSEVTDNPVV